MNDDKIRDMLEEVMKEVRKSPEHWRFNYSVGTTAGCYGADYKEDNEVTDF